MDRYLDITNYNLNVYSPIERMKLIQEINEYRGMARMANQTFFVLVWRDIAGIVKASTFPVGVEADHHIKDIVSGNTLCAVVKNYPPKTV